MAFLSSTIWRVSSAPVHSMTRTFALIGLLTLFLVVQAHCEAFPLQRQHTDLEAAPLQKRADAPGAHRPVRYYATPDYFWQKHQEAQSAGYLRKAEQNLVRYEDVNSRDPERLNRYVAYYKNSMNALPYRANKYEMKRMKSVDKERMWTRLANKHYEGQGATEEEIESHLEEKPDDEVEDPTNAEVDGHETDEGDEASTSSSSTRRLTSELRALQLRRLRAAESTRSFGDEGMSSYSSQRLQQLYEKERRKREKARLRQEREDLRNHLETDGQRAKYLQNRAAQLAEGDVGHFDMARNRRRMKSYTKKMFKERDVEKLEKLQRGYDKTHLKMKAVLDQDIPAMQEFAQRYTESAQRHEARYHHLLQSQPRLRAKKKAWQDQTELAKLEQRGSSAEEEEDDNIRGTMANECYWE